jgi:hypothetical protein
MMVIMHPRDKEMGIHNQIKGGQLTPWAEIHQALVSQFALLAEFFIVKVTIKD